MSKPECQFSGLEDNRLVNCRIHLISEFHAFKDNCGPDFTLQIASSSSKMIIWSSLSSPAMEQNVILNKLQVKFTR